jgi:hypothetical protein
LGKRANPHNRNPNKLNLNKAQEKARQRALKEREKARKRALKEQEREQKIALRNEKVEIRELQAENKELRKKYENALKEISKLKEANKELKEDNNLKVISLQEEIRKEHTKFLSTTVSEVRAVLEKQEISKECIEKWIEDLVDNYTKSLKLSYNLLKKI